MNITTFLLAWPTVLQHTNDSWKISWETTICRYVSYTWTTSSSSHIPMKNMWTGWERSFTVYMTLVSNEHQKSASSSKKRWYTLDTPSPAMEPDPAKTETIRNWPTPKMPQDVCRFLGLAWYYRKLVKDFSKIAAPLTVLMPTTVKKKQGKRKQPSQKPWVWGDEQETAFRHLKDILSSPPVLGYADYSLPFELHTDASAMTSGAVLYQEKDGLRMLTSLKFSQTLMYLCTLSTKNWTGRVNEHCIRTTCCRLGVYLLTLRIHPTSLMQPPSEDLYLSQERRHLMTQVGKNNHPVLPPGQIFPQTWGWRRAWIWSTNAWPSG